MYVISMYVLLYVILYNYEFNNGRPRVSLLAKTLFVVSNSWEETLKTHISFSRHFQLYDTLQMIILFACEMLIYSYVYWLVLNVHTH